MAGDGILVALFFGEWAIRIPWLRGFYAFWLCSSLAWSGTPSSTTPGLEHDVVFTEFSPLARSEALAERLLTPLTSSRLLRRAERSGAPMREYSLDLASEKYVLYVPPNRPLNGYSLLVFIEPWDDAGVPRDWIETLKQHGMIFVTALNSGNTQQVYERRIPLALVAAFNVTKQYAIEPQRVYVGGLSGGSRVALRMALAYPDVFHAALLHSASDPIGTAQVPLPSPELFEQFQESTRLVYLTGQYDTPNIEGDKLSRASLTDWCVSDVVVKTFTLAGHELTGRSDFESALTLLEMHGAPLPQRLTSCREYKAKELDAKLQEVQELWQRGKREKAASRLAHLDTQFGGLAAPGSLELAAEMNDLD